MMANAAVPPGPTEEMATRLMTAITSACDAYMAKSSGRRRRCTGEQARSPTSGAHACEREGSPREHVVGQMKAPPKRAMPPQDVSCALPSRPAGAIVIAVTLEELRRACGRITTATASALQHTSMIEIKDLDKSVTKEEITMALDALLGVPVSRRDPREVPAEGVRRNTGGRGRTTGRPGGHSAEARPCADRLGELPHPCSRGGCALLPAAGALVNVAARCKVSRPHGALLPMRPKGPPSKGLQRPTILELPSGPEDHPGPPMMRILQLNLNHCEAAQDLLCDTISKLRIDVAILCEQYKNLLHPTTWLADADGQAAIWVHGGIPVQERPARVHPYFAWARIGGIFFFSVYAPPRLSEREFSALLANITEKARGRRPLVIAGDFNAWSTEWGCRETRPRASILLDSLALLDAVLLNTGDVPTFNGRQGSSIVDLTFVCETLAPRVKSWTVSGRYTHSDHQVIFFEIEDTGTSTRALDAPEPQNGMPVHSMRAVSLCRHVQRIGRSRDRGGYGVEPHVRHHRCMIAMSRLGCPQAKQPSFPFPGARARWRLCFRGCRAGPPLRLPRRAEELITGRHLGGTQRSSVEDKGALGARPGWRAQHGAQARCSHAS
ncbi:unnamed protein product [Trichogramma brassicae]|uniref:Endonuclease/exonuclease/phosphatase domain-containing protein n=1 Tax=Trichogramma brassicae TaxID=86971 RepID=A0A6H5IKT2_9HYME|nr:unnamed protein product [Trichogramma brassicae]